jgi:hypothetical protein
VREEVERQQREREAQRADADKKEFPVIQTWAMYLLRGDCQEIAEDLLIAFRPHHTQIDRLVAIELKRCAVSNDIEGRSILTCAREITKNKIEYIEERMSASDLTGTR